MSPPLPREVPAIDFDLDGAFARWQIIAVMCWPNIADRRRRLATIWADLADTVDEEYGVFLEHVARTLAFHGVPPPTEALEYIIDGCARDAAHREVLIRFIEEVALPPTDDPNLGLTARFWARVIAARDRPIFIPPKRFFWEHLINPIGGLRVLADGPAFDEIRQEIADCIRGHPMLSGLSWYLIATINAHHPDLTLSYNETYRIFSATFDDLRVSSVDWLKTRLPRWHCVASMWAGVLAEADCWLNDALLDIAKFEDTLLDVLESSERRRRAICHAAWFTAFVVENPSDNIRRKQDQIIRFPNTIPAIKPSLRPLTGRALSAAKRYR
jgi:hypothetical protein